MHILHIRSFLKSSFDVLVFILPLLPSTTLPTPLHKQGNVWVALVGTVEGKGVGEAEGGGSVWKAFKNLRQQE